MRYLLVLLLFTVQTVIFGNATNDLQKSDVEKVLTFKKSSLEARNNVLFRFQGQYDDGDTGLYYNRFRYYSPESGTYISQDPIGLLGNNPNFYAYVPDVNTWVDVLGLDCTKKGKATINHYKNGSRTGHFSVEIEFNGKKLHTHQVGGPPIVNDVAQKTYIMTSKQFSPGNDLTKASREIELPNAEKAMQKQLDLMDSGNLGVYDEATNSCLTHVADVLEAGGHSPTSRTKIGLFKLVKGLGF